VDEGKKRKEKKKSEILLARKAKSRRRGRRRPHRATPHKHTCSALLRAPRKCNARRSEAAERVCQNKKVELSLLSCIRSSSSSLSISLINVSPVHAAQSMTPTTPL